MHFYKYMHPCNTIIIKILNISVTLESPSFPFAAKPPMYSWPQAVTDLFSVTIDQFYLF